MYLTGVTERFARDVSRMNLKCLIKLVVEVVIISLYHRSIKQCYLSIIQIRLLS
jgi:hypothetical protein